MVVLNERRSNQCEWIISLWQSNGTYVHLPIIFEKENKDGGGIHCLGVVFGFGE
jgi:hypothetical protein